MTPVPTLSEAEGIWSRVGKGYPKFGRIVAMFSSVPIENVGTLL